MADEEIVEEQAEEGAEAQDEGGGGAEFVPEASPKIKSDIYTALMVLGFFAFLTGVILVGMELHEHYDVQFWVFTKK